MWRVLRGLAVLALLCGGWAGARPTRAAPTAGHTYTVNSTLDQLDANPTDGVCASTPGGVCTLRAAIMESNFVTEPNTITVPAGVYLLTLSGYDDGALAGDLDLGHAVTILGAGSGATIIDGNGAVTGDRVFQILPSAQNVTLQGLTIRGGRAPNTLPATGGGGLYQEGSRLNMYDVILEGNSADQGGAIATADAVFTQVALNQVVVRNNAASFVGGGLYIRNSGAVILERSQVYSNTASNGGGLSLGCASATLGSSTVSGNTASGNGGGLDYECSGGTGPTLTYSTVSGNVAGTSGGGVYSRSPLTLVNSTVSDNLAHVEGGGVYVDGSQTKLYSATMAGNQVFYHIAAQPGLGGGVFITHTATLIIHNSIIATNIRQSDKGPVAADDCVINGGGGSYYYSLFTTLDYCGLLVEVGLIVGQDPLLGPLAENGGPTPTRALLPGSPAIDAGDPAGCTNETGGLLPLDQRVAKRPASGCDIGAYELVPEADLAVSLSAAPSPARVGAPLTYTLLLTNTGPVTSSAPILADSLPVSVTVATVSASQGNCNGGLCQPGAIAAGARLTVTLVVTPTAAGWLTNYLNGNGSEFDPVLANNSASLTVLVLRQVFLPLVRR